MIDALEAVNALILKKADYGFPTAGWHPSRAAGYAI